METVSFFPDFLSGVRRDDIDFIDTVQFVGLVRQKTPLCIDNQ